VVFSLLSVDSLSFWYCAAGTRKRIELGEIIKDNDAKIPTIFEGTSEIQQLVIARAISGLRIE
jgi:alkylation response protein AidB-like acyl-CoA dehydrogenase